MDVDVRRRGLGVETVFTQSQRLDHFLLPARLVAEPRDAVENVRLKVGLGHQAVRQRHELARALSLPVVVKQLQGIVDIHLALFLLCLDDLGLVLEPEQLVQVLEELGRLGAAGITLGELREQGAGFPQSTVRQEYFLRQPE